MDVSIRQRRHRSAAAHPGHRAVAAPPIEGAAPSANASVPSLPGASPVGPGVNYRFVAPHLGRKVMLASAVGGAVLALACCGLAATTGEVGWVVGAGAAAMISVLLWTIAAGRAPQVVTVDGSVIEITRPSGSHRFDLTDPNVEIAVRDGEIGFATFDRLWISVFSDDVDWPVFSDVIMHYQGYADVRAEDRTQRYLR